MPPARSGRAPAPSAPGRQERSCGMLAGPGGHPQHDRETPPHHGRPARRPIRCRTLPRGTSICRVKMVRGFRSRTRRVANSLNVDVSRCDIVHSGGQTDRRPLRSRLRCKADIQTSATPEDRRNGASHARASWAGRNSGIVACSRLCSFAHFIQINLTCP